MRTRKRVAVAIGAIALALAGSAEARAGGVLDTLAGPGGTATAPTVVTDLQAATQPVTTIIQPVSTTTQSMQAVTEPVQTITQPVVPLTQAGASLTQAITPPAQTSREPVSSVPVVGPVLDSAVAITSEPMSPPAPRLAPAIAPTRSEESAEVDAPGPTVTPAAQGAERALAPSSRAVPAREARPPAFAVVEHAATPSRPAMTRVARAIGTSPRQSAAVEEVIEQRAQVLPRRVDITAPNRQPRASAGWSLAIDRVEAAAMIRHALLWAAVFLLAFAVLPTRASTALGRRATLAHEQYRLHVVGASLALLLAVAITGL
jgi:hypothetical protein